MKLSHYCMIPHPIFFHIVCLCMFLCSPAHISEPGLTNYNMHASPPFPTRSTGWPIKLCLTLNRSMSECCFETHEKNTHCLETPPDLIFKDFFELPKVLHTQSKGLLRMMIYNKIFIELYRLLRES